MSVKGTGDRQGISERDYAYDNSSGLSVSITPRDPGRGAALRGQVSGAQRVDGWFWYLNDQLIYEGGSGVLPAHQGIRGDHITLVVFADGQESSDTVIVGNSPPEILDIGLGSNQIFRGVDITVFPDAVDLDEDPVEFRYVWFINGEEVIGVTGATLPGNEFYKGDTVSLHVIPSDHEKAGPVFYPEPFIIPNGPPRFVSDPPREFSGNEYRYQVKAEDPDGDPLTYHLEQGPAGMTLSDTGLLVWPISVPSTSENAVRILVSDDEGLWASQEFTLMLGH